MKKLLSSKKFIIGAIVAVLLIVAIVIVSTTVLIPLTKYNRATSTFEEGNFKSAKEMFTELGYYKDSPWQVVRCELALLKKDIGEEKKTIKFGVYEQDGVTENGGEPIEWIVDEYDPETKVATLISLKILDAQPVNDSDNVSAPWKDSKLQEWLGSTFLNKAFSEAQREALLTFSNTNGYLESNLVSHSAGQISLLDVDELREIAKYGYTGGADEYAKTTAYAEEQGAKDNVYWTRTQLESGSEIFMAADCSEFGVFQRFDADEKHGIRPVIKLNLDY